MRILGADLTRERTGHPEAVNTLIALDESGRIADVDHPQNLPELATRVAERARGEPFVLAVNVAVVAPPRAARSRKVDNLARRRFGFRITSGARSVPETPATGGDTLLAALAAAGHPCLPYPDRDQRHSGLAEVHAGLVLKALVWESALATSHGNHPFREEIFRAYTPPSYRPTTKRTRDSWAERLGALELLLRSLGHVQGYDLRPAREALNGAASDAQVEAAASVLDAAVMAGTARRYLDSPEACVFLGDREHGYMILPADGLIRRLALHDRSPERGQLFPRASLSERLGDTADIRPLALLEVPGRPQRLEAVFREPPLYEFDNLDEMMWWKHTRHLAGPPLPVEGLQELNVRLGDGASDTRSDNGPALKLVRSRHRTMSFRFDPPASWRIRLPTRDGRTYPFRVERATYEALAAEE